jgi:hypothetical protein
MATTVRVIGASTEVCLSLKIFTEKAATLIAAPQILLINITTLPSNVYGAVDDQQLSRIHVNSKLDIQLMKRVIAHELVHVEQRILGRLKFFGQSASFDGKVYNRPDILTISSSEYKSLPWEVEAIERQGALYAYAETNENSD